MPEKATTIVRRPDFAGGGITEAERAAMALLARTHATLVPEMPA